MKKILLTFLFIPIIASGQVEKILDFSMAYPTKVNNKIVFVRNEPTFGSELWVTDGTTQGTTILMDIIPGAASSNPYLLTLIDNVIYFTVNDHQIWRTDGTTGGTYNMVNNNLISNPSGFTKANGFIFFTSGNNTYRRLWRMQTTPNSELEVKENATKFFENVKYEIVKLDDDNILFNAYTSAHRWAIWRTNGLVSEFLIDLFPKTSPDYPQLGYQSIKFGDKLLFSAWSEQYGAEPFITDGTTPGTILLKDIFTSQSYFDASSPQYFIKVNNDIFFSAKDNINGYELWKTDVTTLVTQIVKDITPGNNNNSWSVSGLTAFNNQVYFSKNDGINGSQLWKSDGTENGTIMVTKPNDNNLFSSNFFATQNLLFFNSYDSNNTTGIELWAVNQNNEVFLIQDIAPGSNSSAPSDFIELNGTIYFNASIDGTYAGTKVFKINPQTLTTKQFNTKTIVVYPNPTSGLVNINVENISDYDFQLYSYLGQKLQVAVRNGMLDLSSFSSGVYQLNIIDKKSNQQTSQKIIKQ